MEASEQVLDANARHMQTEKRRRDRIANGFETLRDLLPNQDRRTDKATFLQEVVEYVRRLQATVGDVLKHGGLSSLPEEVQWQIRLLLPRQEDGQAAAPIAVPEPMLRSPLQSNESADPTPASQGGPEANPPINVPRPVQQDIDPPEEAAADTHVRISQLQQMLRELQSQQAASSQQLQMQQATLMQSQVFNALKLQHLVQQPNSLPLQQGSSLELFHGVQMPMQAQAILAQPQHHSWQNQTLGSSAFPGLRDASGDPVSEGKGGPVISEAPESNPLVPDNLDSKGEDIVGGAGTGHSPHRTASASHVKHAGTVVHEGGS